MPDKKTDVKPDSQAEEQPADAAPPSDPPRDDIKPEDILTTTQRREQSMDAINAARLDMLKGDDVDVSGFGDETPPDETPPEEPGEEKPEDEEAVKAEEKTTEKPAEEKPEDKDPVYEMTIQGKTVEVPLSRLKENYGLDQAGRQLMTDAAQIYKDAKAYETSVLAQPPAETLKEEAVPDPLDAINWEETINAIQIGETDEAAEALKGLVTTLRGIPATTGEAPVNVAEIEQRVMNAVDMKQSLLRFDAEYEDILSDPITSDIALQATQRGFRSAMQDSQANGTPMPSYWDILDAAGGSTRTWLEGIKGKTEPDPDSEESQPEPKEPAQPVVDISPDKTEAKRSSVAPPSQRAPRTPATGEGSSVISFDEQAEQRRRSADIADMQKQRGQNA